MNCKRNKSLILILALFCNMSCNTTEQENDKFASLMVQKDEIEYNLKITSLTQNNDFYLYRSQND